MGEASPIFSASADHVIPGHRSQLSGLFPPEARYGQTVLLTGQVDPSYNGVYRIHRGRWHRALDWQRHDRHHGDPVWVAKLDTMRLSVRVPHAAWFWEWEVECENEGDVARGSLYVVHADADEDQWDYQDVGLAQGRCEAVAYALLHHEGLDA